jgi:hypothetical protein
MPVMKLPLGLVSLVLATSVGYSADAPSAAAPSAPRAPMVAPGAPLTLTAPPAPPAPSPEAVAAAKVLMKNMRFAETLGKVLDTRKAQMAQMIDRSASMLPPGTTSATPEELAAYKKDMMAIYLADMSVDSAIDGMVQVYAQLFTVDQLKGLADFYASPAGQALVDKTLELQQKSGMVLQGRQQVVAPKLEARQQAFVTAHKIKPAPAPAPAVQPAPSAAPAPAHP